MRRPGRCREIVRGNCRIPDSGSETEEVIERKKEGTMEQLVEMMGQLMERQQAQQQDF